MSDEKAFYGKYRGVVTDTDDPLMQGRIMARVPEVWGSGESWALPCVPFAGNGMGFFGLPDTGAGVWIEFEHGDPDHPIWTGACWGSTAEVPSPVLTPPQSGKVLLLTSNGTSLLLDDTPGTGGITLQTSTGQKIVLSSTGIEIDSGAGAKISLKGPKVSVNDGALEVT
ncbi:phage baseplate assembly protein V [Streptomyces sp. NPDC059900]|uniref:phage baseplate assembly protein V n=1 Tax=Streptomyces sp. NPDC059900 TaxID=3155816 RepID=UPI003441FCBA